MLEGIRHRPRSLNLTFQVALSRLVGVFHRPFRRPGVLIFFFNFLIFLMSVGRCTDSDPSQSEVLLRQANRFCRE